LILWLLGCTASNSIDVWLKTEQEEVTLIIDSISLRANGQAWYQDWHLLDSASSEIDIHPEYQIIAQGEALHETYHHIFIDALTAFTDDTEIIDVFEPIALDRPFTIKNNDIYVDAVVLDAPSGPAVFLIDATVR